MLFHWDFFLNFICFLVVISEEMANNSSQNQDFSDLLEAFDIGDLPKELDKQVDKGSENSSRLVTPTFDNGSADNSVDQRIGDTSSVSEEQVSNGKEAKTPATINITPDTDKDFNSDGAEKVQTIEDAIISQSNSFDFRIDSVRSVDESFLSDITPAENGGKTAGPSTVLSQPLSPDCYITDAFIVKQEKIDDSAPSVAPSTKQQTIVSHANIIQNNPRSEPARLIVGNREQHGLLNSIHWTTQPKTMPASHALSRLVKVVENPSLTTVVKDSRIPNLREVSSIPIAPQPQVVQPRKTSAPVFVPISMKNGILVQSGPPTSAPVFIPPAQPSLPNIQPRPSVVQPVKAGSNKIKSNLFVMSTSETAKTSTHKITMRKVVVGGKTQMQSVIIGDDTTQVTKVTSAPPPLTQAQDKKTQPQGVKLGTVQDVLVRPASVPIYTPEEPPQHIKDTVKKIPKYKCIECGDTFMLETSWANHRRRRTCIITLDCPVCKKMIVCYNRCVLMAHLAMPKHASVTLNDAYYQILPKNLMNNAMAVQMEPAPKKTLEEIFAGLPAFLDKMAQKNGNKVNNHIEEIIDIIDDSPKNSSTESIQYVSPEGNTRNAKTMSPNYSPHTSPELGKKLEPNKKSSSPKEVQHIPDHDDLTCVECAQTFKDKSKLMMHFSTVRRNSYFKLRCPECSKFLTSGCSLRAHMRLHKDTKPYVCPECGAFIHKKEILKSHVEKYCCHYNRIVRLKCGKCEKMIYSPDAFMTHLHDAHVELYLKCQRCPMAFRSHEGILKHAEKNHNTTDIVWKNIYKCPLCDTVFHDLKALNQHLRMHVNDRKNDPYMVYHCSECEEDFITLNTYKYHMSTEHGHKLILYFCNQCGETFQYQAALDRHISSHSVPKCSLCSEKFPNRAALNQHSSQAHNLKVKITDISRSSSRSSSIESPTSNGIDIQEVEMVEIKNVPKWIPCSECGHRYPNKESLENHIKLDHQSGRSSMPCHLCGIVLSDNAALQHHLDTLHIGNKSKFVCHLCSKEGVMNMSFTKITTLEKHLKSAHRLTRSLVDIDLFSVDAENPDDRIQRESSADSDTTENAQPPRKRLRVDGETAYSCAKCSFCTENRKEFTEHIETHKTDYQDSHQCQECGMSFVIQTALKRHLFMVHKIKNFSKYQSDTGVDLVTPEKEARSVSLCSITNGHAEPEETEPSNPLECRVCHKVSETDTALRTHMRSHGMAFIRSKRNMTSPPSSVT